MLDTLLLVPSLYKLHYCITLRYAVLAEMSCEFKSFVVVWLTNTPRKGKSFPLTVDEDFHPYFDIRHYWDGRVVRFARRAHFTPMDIAWYS